MKVAIISDVHSNFCAFEEVLKDIKEMEIFCCGDVVGYNPFPNEVVELFRSRDISSIMGNHDNAVITGDVSWFNPTAARAILWTREELKKENLRFLKSLSEFYDGDFHMVHGSPENRLEEYVYEDDPPDTFKGFFACTTTDTIILGHTHVPFVKRIDDRLIFNPGSVGQPRDGNPEASYAIFDTVTKEVKLKRVEYDVQTVADKILEKGLPERLASRLFLGR